MKIVEIPSKEQREELDTKFAPGVTLGDRIHFWTNFNVGLYKMLSEVKLNQTFEDNNKSIKAGAKVNKPKVEIIEPSFFELFPMANCPFNGYYGQFLTLN